MNFEPFSGTNYIKITITSKKPITSKNMINVPGILAKYKKPNDLHDSLKIYRYLKYDPAEKIRKRLPWVAKKLVWEAISENQDFTQKSPTP